MVVLASPALVAAPNPNMRRLVLGLRLESVREVR